MYLVFFPNVHPRPAIHRLATNVSEALFCTGVTDLFRDPFLGRPILGASNHYYSGLFANFVDYLIAGVRKHGKHLIGIYFTKSSETKTIDI